MSISGKIRAGAAYVEVLADTSKLQRNLKNAQAELQNFGRSCTAIGKDMLMFSGALALPMGLAVKGFAEFDDQMRLVKAVTKSTAAEFESMTAAAAKLGRETSFTAKQVADGMVSLGRMGFAPKEIEQAIQPTLDLARATGTELGEAADIAANSMRIFGIEAGKMSSVADVLTAAANGSAQTLTDLFEALKMAGPQAKAAGENITDTAGAIGILANLGIKGSLAGTALRKSFSQFAKTDVQEKLKAVGIATVDTSGNLRKMKDIMADIGRVMATMPSAEKISFAEEIFDIRGSLAGLSLGGNVAELEAFIAKLENVEGTARATAEEMDAGLGGSFRKLMSAVEGAMNAIAKSLEPTLQPLIGKITAVTLAVIGWIEENSGLVTAFAATVAGAAALGAALLAVGLAAKGFAAATAICSVGLKIFSITVKSVIGLKTIYLGCLASWAAATLAFNAASAAGVGICGALKAAIIALLASNPVGWILAIAGAVAGLVIALNSLLGKTEECTNAMAGLLNQNDAARRLDQQRMERLQQLAAKHSLTNGEMAEAKRLAGQLEGKYGALGIEINEMAKSVGNLVKAQNALNQAMAQSAIDDLNKKIAEHQENIRKATGYNEDFWTGWDGTGRKMLNLGWDYWTMDGSESKAQQAIKQNESYIAGQQAEIAQLEQRKAAIASGSSEAVTGTTPTEDEELRGKTEQESARQAVSMRQAQEAKDEVARLEEKFASERRSDLENELLEIERVNAEYKKLLQTMLDFEKAKSDDTQDKAKIAELEKKLANADSIADERIAAAKSRSLDSMRREAENFARRFAEGEQRRNERRAEAEQDRKLDETMTTDPEAGRRMLQDMILQYQDAAKRAKEQFQKELESAQADGAIDDDERRRIGDAQTAFTRAESMLDKYEGKLRDAQDGTQEAVEKTEKPQGAFLAAALESLGGGSSADRTAKATELIATHTKKTNDLLKKNTGQAVFT